MEEESKLDVLFWVEYAAEFGTQRLVSEPVGLNYLQ